MSETTEAGIDAQPRGRARLRTYALLIVGVLAVNAAVFAWGVVADWWQPHARSLQVIAAISQVNIVFAVLPRQNWFVNLLSWSATRPSTRWPLRVRWRLAQYYQVGGAHIGAALSGTLWYVLYVVLLAPAWADGEHGIDDYSAGVAVAVVLTLVTVCVLAAPQVRARHHELFEASHRFGGWLVLVLGWVHAAIVRLRQNTVPPIGTTRAISRHPLFGWHPFACVPAADGESGYRMVVSRAGGWTADFIDNPPSAVWVRGLPTAGVANAKRLFHRVLYVATGSGIGPALGHLLSDTQGSRLVWVTRDPRQTYGDELVDEVETAQPNAVIWNTSESGKPDVLDVTYRAYVESGADAVICIANRPVTTRVVGELERRGIPAFGPIWDS